MMYLVFKMEKMDNFSIYYMYGELCLILYFCLYFFLKGLIIIMVYWYFYIEMFIKVM